MSATAVAAFPRVAVVVNDTKAVIGRISQLTDSAILFYSGGKDSLVLLDLMAPHFKRIVCVFMYFVKGLRHIQPYLEHAKRYGNVEILEVPHYMLTDIYGSGVYCLPNPTIPRKTLKDVDEVVRAKTGINFSFYGMKKVDGLHRNLMLRTYDQEMICWATNKVYPLSKWKKADVLAYVKAKRLPPPINYGLAKQSAGLSFDPQVFAWLRENYPEDLEKIYKAFPLSKQILYEYDRNQQVPKVQSPDNSPVADQRGSIQPEKNIKRGKKAAPKQP